MKNALIALGLSLTLLLPSCNASKAVKGGTVGAAGGAAAGAAIGSRTDDTALGAILGAVIGGTAGTLIGRKMDKQAEEMERELEEAEVTRVGEGIQVTFDSGLMFATNKATLNATTEQNLDKLATSLMDNPMTEIIIEGHTDSDGTDSYNQDLSVQRAQSVKTYLVGKGIATNRLITMGYGESQPVADNSTTAGKQKNRRVELAIYADAQMQRQAKNGTLDD